jgi:putative membrane protein
MSKTSFRKRAGVVGALGLIGLLGSAAAASAASMNAADRQFMNNAAHIDMVEAHEGQMAETQAMRSDVRDMAKTVAEDHTKAYEQLSLLAAKTGVSIPKGINAGRDPEISTLTRLHGDKFDRTFSRDEVTDHQRALAAFKREASAGHDPDVKAYASQMIPTLEKHLKLAQDCAAAKHS